MQVILNLVLICLWSILQTALILERKDKKMSRAMRNQHIHYVKNVQIRTRNNSVFGHFSRSNSSMEQKILLLFMMEWNILVFNATAWKVLKYGVFSGRYYPTFGLNTERCSVSLLIQSKCGKIQTRRKKSVIGHFSCSVLFSGSLHFQPFWNSCPRNCYDVMNKLFFHQSIFDLSIKLSIVGSETGKMKSMM